jgi:hypothetical protein
VNGVAAPVGTRLGADVAAGVEAGGVADAEVRGEAG